MVKRAYKPTYVKVKNSEDELVFYLPEDMQEVDTLYGIIKTTMDENYDIQNLIPLVAQIMRVVNIYIDQPKCGEHKKKIVMSLVFLLIKTNNNITEEQKDMLLLTLYRVIPAAIDTMVMLSKGLLNVKELPFVEDISCFSGLFNAIKPPELLSKKTSNDMDNKVKELGKLK